MATAGKWYFTKEQLANTPSRRCGIDADKELSYRQQAANFIQDMGQRLQVSQLCINTAIVYMHRFYVFHSLSQFHRNAIAAAALFLAAKVEEQPRKLEHVIKIAHTCLHRDQTPIDTRSEQYLEQAQDLVFNENVLLQTLGFDVAIDHPHTHVVKCCHLVKASKDLAQTSYFMASNSLHLTTMCLQYKPTVVASFCIHLACKWSNWEIPQSNEGKDWYWYVDMGVTTEELQRLTAEFLHIFDKCPSRLKRKIMSISANQSPSINHPSLTNSPFETEPRRVQSPATDGGPSFQSSRPFPPEDSKKPSAPSVPTPSATASSSSSSSNRMPMDYREYREKKERERIEREKITTNPGQTVNNPSSGQLPPEVTTKSHHSHSHHVKQHPTASSSSSSQISGGNSGKHGNSSVTNVKPPHHNHHGGHRNDGGKSGMSQNSQRHSSVTSSTSSATTTAPTASGIGTTTTTTSATTTGQSNRPRNPREYGISGTGSLNATTNPQNIYNNPHQTKETTMINSDSIGDVSVNPEATRDPEKLTNHTRNETKHEKNVQISQQRGYDPRTKMPTEHRVKDEAKTYAKYQEQQRGRKISDVVEQRTDETRKSIEKPIVTPAKNSTRAEIVQQREDYMANMLKPSHNPKTNVGQNSANLSNPSNSNSSRNPSEYILQPINREKSKNSSQQTPQTQHNPKYDKNDVKNGNSQSNLSEEPRNRSQNSQQQSNVSSQPMKQHKSLFSPDKTTNPRESHSSRLSSRQTRQKQSPNQSTNFSSSSNQQNSTITKNSKMLERVPDPTGGNLDLTNFESSRVTTMNNQETKQQSTSHGKRHRTTSIGDSTKIIKNETLKSEHDENRDNYETMKLLGRVPDLIQPIRDNPTPNNGRGTNSSLIPNDLKIPELLKPLDQEISLRQQSTLTNGIDALMSIKTEDIFRNSQDSGLGMSQLSNQSNLEYFSPMKSAQSISALLQEPLAPMPSLLTAITDYPQLPEPQMSSLTSLIKTENSHHDNQRQQRSTEISSEKNVAQTTTTMLNSMTNVKEEKELLSTVDISALSAPQQIIPEAAPATAQIQPTSSAHAPNLPLTSGPISTEDPNVVATATTAAPSSSHKSEHHKSEKKKKKEKHKHKEKDKEKSREKRKHKHKEKDKEKEKHIKITIPKDKLNLSTDMTITTSHLQTNSSSNLTEKKSPQPTHGLKIKIPKERLKVNNEIVSHQSSSTHTIQSSSSSHHHHHQNHQQQIQGPLKIKIRTSGGNAMGEGSETSCTMSTSSSRKRDRNEAAMNEATVAPPSKKHHQHHGSQSQTTIQGGSVQPNVTIPSFGQPIPQLQPPPQQQQQRQNGRHYSSNNKEKHSSSHHKSSGKLSQAQQQALIMQQQQQQLLQQQQQQQHHHHHQHSHAT